MGQVLKEKSSPDDNDNTGKLSASDRVAGAILQDIRSGRLVPGQHLLEPELTSRLGISRGSLREALKHLAAAGIVDLNRFRGAYIAALDRKSVLDLLDTLEPLARLAARLAATNCPNDRAAQRLVKSAKVLEDLRLSGQRGDYLNERRRFYDMMVEMGGNVELARAMPLSRTDLFRAQVETRQSESQRRRHAEGYAKIAAAVQARDAAAADKAVADHFAGTRKTMAELPAEVFPNG
ncbi:MAG: GntR family transcriptional regulator [Novosphingobium sp.]|nr:GntR family transcriptional regulator [Novosphingobium sp.]